MNHHVCTQQQLWVAQPPSNLRSRSHPAAWPCLCQRMRSHYMPVCDVAHVQVMETKDAAVRDELYEEAQLLRRRQQDYKSELVGLPGRWGQWVGCSAVQCSHWFVGWGFDMCLAECDAG